MGNKEKRGVRDFWPRGMNSKRIQSVDPEEGLGGVRGDSSGEDMQGQDPSDSGLCERVGPV